MIPVIQSSSFFLSANCTQVDLFLINFYCSLPFHILKVDTSHETWFLVFKVLPPVSLSAFNFWNN